MQSKAATIAEYLRELPPGERAVIQSLDGIVRSAAPNAVGSMKYGMPTYAVGSRLIAFNAQKNYYSFYANPQVVKRHLGELEGLEVGKSCIRFRKLDKALLGLLGRIARAVAA